MIALAVIILVAAALAFLLMFAQAVRLPTPRPPERGESRKAADDASWEEYVGAPYEWHSP